MNDPDKPTANESDAAAGLSERERIQASLDRMYDIFKDIARTADEVSLYRCPYKNRHNRCTAQFGCRNQRRTGVPDELPICAGDDKLDYRKAWES